MKIRIAVRTFLVLLLAAANVCAIVLSASGTIDLFRAAGADPRIAPFAVPMLEVVSVAGAIGMVVAAGAMLRVWSIGLVAVAMTVTAIAGYTAYHGWVGVIAPVMVQALAHGVDFACRDALRIGRAGEQAERAPERAAWLRERWARATAALSRWDWRETPHVAASNGASGGKSVAEQPPSDPIERARWIDARSGIERTDWRARALAVLAVVPLSQRDLMRAFEDDEHVRIRSGRALDLIRTARARIEPNEEAS